MEIIDIIQFVLIALLGFCFYALRNGFNALCNTIELLVKLNDKQHPTSHHD